MGTKTVERNLPNETYPTSLTPLQPAQWPLEMWEIFISHPVYLIATINACIGARDRDILFDVTWKITRQNWLYSCIGFTQTMCVEFGLETWLVPSNIISALSIDIQPICDQYELETWLAAKDETRVLALEIQSLYACYCTQHGSFQVIKFLFCRTNCCLNGLK